MDRVVILTVRRPYADYLVDGVKKWEIRKRPVKFRGDIVIVTDGKAIGRVTLKDIIGPFDVEELEKYHSNHLADMEFLKDYSRGQKLFAWVIGNPVRFQNPIEVEILTRLEGPLRLGKLIG